MNSIYQTELFVPKENQPQCVFFETFLATMNPDADPNDLKEPILVYCHMSGKEGHALTCLGDYLKCPLAYGKSEIIELIK